LAGTATGLLEGLAVEHEPADAGTTTPTARGATGYAAGTLYGRSSRCHQDEGRHCGSEKEAGGDQRRLKQGRRCAAKGECQRTGGDSSAAAADSSVRQRDHAGKWRAETSAEPDPGLPGAHRDEPGDRRGIQTAYARLRHAPREL